MTEFIDLNETKKTTIHLTKPGDYLLFIYNLEKEISIVLAEKVQAQILGLFIGTNQTQFHINTAQIHTVPDSTSNLLIKGAFFDESEFSYHGQIQIKRQAQKSYAYQKNQNLILSPKAKVNSEPFLEIEANDVFCTHGSTTGKLPQTELQYLYSRGLSPRQSEQLLVFGFIREIFAIMRTKAIEEVI